MSAHVLNRSALGITAAIVVLTGCGGGSSASVAPFIPVAAHFDMNFVNSVVAGSTPSSVSFAVVDSTTNCVKFPEPFSDDQLDYKSSALRTVQLVDCGTSGWFTVKFHALDVSLADTIVKWTVSEPGLSESIVQEGGLCIKQTNGTEFTETITAKPTSGCPAH